MAFLWRSRVLSAALVLSLLVLGESKTKIYTVEVVNEYPHDRDAFTQGLVYWENDTLYESTGLHFRSSVRRVALQTGEVEALQKMDDELFGEGLALLDERLYQVTWQTQTGFIYDRETLSHAETFTHDMNDGWGLATNGKILYGTDGSSTLYHIDTKTTKVMHKRTVRFNDLEVHNLNELEFVDGEVWANIFTTDCIVRISPGSGNVAGWILLPNLKESLIAAGEVNIDVLNGIAWDSNEQRIFVTGKLWPKLFEIKLHLDKKQYTDADVERLCILDPLFPVSQEPYSS